MKGRLAGKTALVTGGASGFGAAIARRFREEGADLVVIDLNEELGRAIAKDLNAIFVRCDVSQGEDIRRAVDNAKQARGALDVVVNNAGITFAAKPADQVTEEEFDRLFAVNVKSLYHMHRHAVPAMRSGCGAAFVNVASVTGVRPGRGLCWYGATKSAVIGVTKALAQELAPMGIRVNVINPMLGETPLLPSFMGGEDTPEIRQRFLSRVPLGRLALPSDVASAALYLASDEAAYLTGVALDVDGGRNI